MQMICFVLSEISHSKLKVQACLKKGNCLKSFGMFLVFVFRFISLN